MTKKYEKGRHWAFVMYPESMPEDWKEIIINSGLQCAISPLHNKDFNPDGEIKKEHYHVIVSYDGGTTTKNNVEEFCKKLNATIPIKLESVRGMYRYHLHLDNPEKYQYDDRDRLLLNGFDKNSVNELTKTEVNKLVKQILTFVIENDIIEYSDLLQILLESDESAMLDVATNHTMVFDSFIRSRRHKRKETLLNSSSYNTYYVNILFFNLEIKITIILHSCLFILQQNISL